MKGVFALGVVAVACAGAQAQWVEVGDAPDLPVPGQITVGVGPLSTISGALAAGDLDVDMYCITVVDPVAFSAKVAAAGFGDSQLFMFELSGLGVNHNDDSPGLGSPFWSWLYAGGPPAGGPPPLPLIAGAHYGLAIAGYDRDPVNGAGAEMWLDAPFGDQTAPDGAGGVLAGWSGFGASGTYVIELTGATFCEIPAPGSLALLGLGGLLLRRRR